MGMRVMEVGEKFGFCPFNEQYMIVWQRKWTTQSVMRSRLQKLQFQSYRLWMLAFGSTAKYVRLHPYQCCFPGHSSMHCCKDASCHMERGTSMSWDDALNKTIQLFSNKSYNFFTCNCHSFVAHCMNRMAFQGSLKWNLVDVMLIVLFKGQFVNIGGFIRAYLPFVVVMTFGHVMAGWMFFYAWAMFTFLLVGWFTYGTYPFRGIIDC
ncbi:unnamed protein product [Sphagnum compactum]